VTQVDSRGSILNAFAYAGKIAGFLLFIVAVVLMDVYETPIVHALEPAAKWMHEWAAEYFLIQDCRADSDTAPPVGSWSRSSCACCSVSHRCAALLDIAERQY
jgi:hypothetical protein